MSSSKRPKVLRVAAIVDGESCEELHQTEPGDVYIRRASGSSLSAGPSLALETGVAAEGDDKDHALPRILVIVGLIMIVIGGGWFAYEVNQHVTENAVLQQPDQDEASSGEGAEGEEGEKKDKSDPTSTIALTLAFLGVIPLVTGRTMLRGLRRRKRQEITVYDGWAQPKDYRKRAPIWLGIGAVLVLGGGGLFAYEVNQHDPDAPITDATRGDMSAFKTEGNEGTGGLGLVIALIGLAPGVIGFMGLQEAPPKKRKRKPKGAPAPANHRLFEWVEDERTYYIDIPAGAKGKVALGKNKASVDQLRKRYGQGDKLRVKLGAKAKGKLLVGQTKIIFRTAKPARAAKRRAFPVELSDPLAHLRLSSLDTAAIAGVAGLAVLMAVWFVKFADRTPPKPSERFVREMGIPASFYEEEEEPEPEENAEEDVLKQEDKEEEKDKVEEEIEEKLDKPDNVSDEAFKEARGVGVALTLGTYGGPGEGTVLDLIQSRENNLGDLFDQGMATTEEYRGGEIGDFVAGGGGIDSTGTVASNEGLKTGEGPAEVGATKKKERKVKAKSSTDDVVGDVDKKGVSATIRRRMPGLEACYEKALRSNSSLGGKMTYTITINTSGRVSDVDIEVDTVGDASVRSCCVAKIKGWRFLVDGEESAEVTFSVAFTG